MQTEVGIFKSPGEAEPVVQELLHIGISRDSISLLTGVGDTAQVQELPTTDAEPDGMGRTVGAVVGGATGMGAGLYLGTAAASMIVPGVGAVLAYGLGAGAVLGLGGAAVGGSLGNAAEHELDQGIPRDDVEVFRQLLRNGRSLVVVNTESAEQATMVRLAMQQNGSESLDDARRQWHSAA